MVVVINSFSDSLSILERREMDRTRLPCLRGRISLDTTGVSVLMMTALLFSEGKSASVFHSKFGKPSRLTMLSAQDCDEQ